MNTCSKEKTVSPLVLLVSSLIAKKKSCLKIIILSHIEKRNKEKQKNRNRRKSLIKNSQNQTREQAEIKRALWRESRQSKSTKDKENKGSHKEQKGVEAESSGTPTTQRRASRFLCRRAVLTTLFLVYVAYSMSTMILVLYPNNPCWI